MTIPSVFYDRFHFFNINTSHDSVHVLVGIAEPEHVYRLGRVVETEGDFGIYLHCSRGIVEEEDAVCEVSILIPRILEHITLQTHTRIF